MEPISLALICAASFGGVVVISAFIRQLMLSRDKLLNDAAQRRALAQEANQLEKMREQMLQSARFESHHKALGANKSAIIHLDTQIDGILTKKAELIERYGRVSIKESSALVEGLPSAENKELCNRLKVEIDKQIKFYDHVLHDLQLRRVSLWDAHEELLEKLLAQEKSRNESMDMIYKQHSSLLEKIYLRHTEYSDHIAQSTIEAGTSTFKTMIMAPIQFLLQYFKLSTGISLSHITIERAARDEVSDAEDDLNDEDVDTPIKIARNERKGVPLDPSLSLVIR